MPIFLVRYTCINVPGVLRLAHDVYGMRAEGSFLQWVLTLLIEGNLAKFMWVLLVWALEEPLSGVGLVP